MGSLFRTLSPVDTATLPEYPISCSERLDGHWFVAFNRARYERSDFRKMAYRDAEVGFYGLELFIKSHGETPLGTLPREDDSLAFLLGISLEKWTGLMAREFNPLYNWQPVRCDNGVVRLAHPVVREVVETALESHHTHKASNEDKAIAMRQRRLVNSLRLAGCSDALCKDAFAVGWIDQWLLDNHRGHRRMPKLLNSIKQALSAATTAGVFEFTNRAH